MGFVGRRRGRRRLGHVLHGDGPVARAPRRRRGRRARRNRGRLPRAATPRPHAGGEHAGVRAVRVVVPAQPGAVRRERRATGFLPGQWLPASGSIATRLRSLRHRERDPLLLPLSHRPRARCSIVVRGVRRSRTGRVLIAIRENDSAARSYGINATRTNLACVRALRASSPPCAGVLLVHQQTGLQVGAATSISRRRACASSRWSSSAGWARCRACCSAPPTSGAPSTSCPASGSSSRPGAGCCWS